MQNSKICWLVFGINVEFGSCIFLTAGVYCIIEKGRKERDSTMTNKWIKGDLDDMIFADCDWQPSER